ncbi:hypothetical protein N9M66_01130 [Litoreibacter sp.]|nr:hypothetical protein [Litoreibacter sp.]
MNQIINMIIRQVVRRVIKLGIDKGVDVVAKRRGDKELTGAQKQSANENAKRAKQMMRMARRTGR